MIDTNITDDGTPFKISDMISPINGQQVINFNDQSNLDSSTQDQPFGNSQNPLDQSAANESFDPFNQGFGAFGDESQS
jgi:2-methylcitrate dehydratase PrpD